MRARVNIGARIWFALLLACATARGQESVAVSGAELDALLSKLVAKARDDGHIGAAAFVVVRDGAVLCQRGFGVEQQATMDPVDPERSLFFAASIGKLFVATAAAQLAEEGKLDLAASVSDFVPSLDASARSVSCESLLTHTSGIEERLLGSLLPADGPQAELADYFARHPPRFVRPTGRAIRYSNLGVALAGRIVERASDLSFNEYVERHVFAPLAMQHSSFREPLPEELARHLVREHSNAAPRIAPYPAGSLAATPADIARFLLAHMNAGATAEGRILSAASAGDMQRQRFTAHAGMPGVALGFFESFVNGRRALFHTGDRGHHSILWFLPEERVGFYLVYVSIADVSGAFREQFTQALADSIIPAPPFVLPALAPDATQRSTRYCGIYRFEAGSPHSVEALAVAPQEIRITPGASGELIAQLGIGGPTMRVVEVAPGLCRTDDAAYLSFASDDRGRSTRLDVSGGISDPFGAERIEFYERGPLHAILLLCTLALFVVRAVWSSLSAFVRLVRRRPASPASSGACAQAWRISGFTCALILAEPALVFVWLLSRPFPFTGVPWILSAAESVLLAATALALFQVLPTFRTLRRGDGPLAQRVWLALAGFGALASLPVLAYWNLLGYRY